MKITITTNENNSTNNTKKSTKMHFTKWCFVASSAAAEDDMATELEAALAIAAVSPEVVEAARAADPGSSADPLRP
jgi:hypothetical protein